MSVKMEAKKISFGFSKTTKKYNLLPSKESAKSETNVELIKCLEGQEIKLVEEKLEEQPLVIPLKESQKTSAALASLMKRRSVLLGEEEPQENNATHKLGEETNANCSHEDIEKRAARELLAEVQNNGSADITNSLVLPVVKPEDLPLDGAKESTLDDYESIPVQDFGKAMLRGMGWIAPPAVISKKGGAPLDDTPMARPKGMGLGADKALNKKPLLVAPEANEVMEIKRNAYVRILGGKYKDLYGQIEGFDDHAGRVIVKIAIGGAKEAFNEFLCQPVSKKEYAQYGKCINSTKYEEFKKKENQCGQIILSKDEKYQIEKNTKDEKINKTERNDFKDNYKYLTCKNEDYREVIKKVNEEHYNNRNDITDRDKEINRRDGNEIYDDRECRKGTNRDECKDRRRETDKDDKDHRREYGRDHKREYHRDDERDYRRDRCRDNVEYESKMSRNYDDHKNKYRYNDSRDDNQDSTKTDECSSSRRNNRECDRSFNRDRERLFQRNEDHHKVIDLNDSSDSEIESHSLKHKKSKKSKHSKKKSKKSRKTKSKYRSDSSETETSSTTESSMDSEDEEHKKYKRQTKRNKKKHKRISKGRK